MKNVLIVSVALASLIWPSLWGMEVKEEEEKVSSFWMVVPPKDAKKCRYLHYLIANDQCTDSGSVYAQARTIKDVYKELAIDKMAHKDFQLCLGHSYGRKYWVENQIRTTPDGYPYEEVYAYLAERKKLSEMKEKCKALPFTVEIMNDADCKKKHVQFMVEMLESKFD